MAPVDSLPAELLMNIFKLTLPSRQEAIDFGRISLNHGAWMLARVCGRWRATALNTPDLWCDLNISSPVGTPVWLNYPIKLLEEQLRRGGEHPMRVALLSTEYPGYTTEKIFTAIVESSPRWVTLDLFSKRWLLPTASLLRMRERIPLLREIHICADSVDGYVGANVFEFAPSLKVIRITEPRLHANNRNINPLSPDYNEYYNDSFVWPSDPPFENIFPWGQLTHYESQCMDPYHFDALCLARNLTVCQATVVVEPRHSTWRAPSQLVRFEHLQKLTLFAPGRLLDCLVLPALQDFFIEVYTHEFPHVVSLIQRSKCSLRKFWMKAHPPVGQYRQILEANPDIVELGIIGRQSLLHLVGPSPNIDEIITSLRADTAASVLVPHLRTFCIHDQAQDLDMGAVLDMIEGRMQNARCARVERLVITKCESRVFPADCQMRIPGLQNAGLEVEFKREYERWLARGLLEYV
ncbi:hypothetical protein B0H13DRAFT_253550 [Mycena leptocephala]|nr:hypothetical protein B0H13DRAFT_253550 [Mycena leptocephala]